MLEITAEINGISYKHILKEQLPEFTNSQMDIALEKPAFRLHWSSSTVFSMSRWVSPKRTRSYPYVNVFKTLPYNDGKRVTIIPVIKDEGKDGERDFLQWDTVSLMSLMGVYVILAYYDDAKKRDGINKIKDQVFDVDYIRSSLQSLDRYKSDALHWNMDQAHRISDIMETALAAYRVISLRCDVALHGEKGVNNRINAFAAEFEAFKNTSRTLARAAQTRESAIVQPNENVEQGQKATIIITNFLKGMYYLTVDEAMISNGALYLTEAKHTRYGKLPSSSDIIDGLFKMILFCNLEKVTVDGVVYEPKPQLKLTGAGTVDPSLFTDSQKELFEIVLLEANENRFEVIT